MGTDNWHGFSDVYTQTTKSHSEWEPGTPPRLTQAEKSQRQFPVDFELMTLTKVQKYTKSLKL